MEKEQIDAWFSRNHKELLKSIKGMLAKKNLIAYSSDLYSMAYLHIIDSIEKVEDEKKLKSMFFNYSEKQTEWSSYLKKDIFGNERMVKLPELFDIADEEDENDIYKNYDIQMMNGAIFIYKESLQTQSDKNFFKLYFIDGFNTKTKLYNYFINTGNPISERSCAMLISEMRNKIREIYINSGGKLGKLRNSKQNGTNNN